MAVNANLLGAGIGAGASILGGILGARAQGQANQIDQQTADRLYGLAAEQQAQRTGIMNHLMPMLDRGMRISGTRPSTPMPQFGAGYGAASGPSAYGGGGTPLFEVPKGSSILGGAGTGAMIGAGLGSIMGPVGALVGGAGGAEVGAIVNGFKKLGANEARDWVNQVQNPMGKLASSIIDPYNAAKQGGTLTAAQQAQAQRDLESLISEYNKAAAQYRTKGPKQNTAIDQSYNTLNPIFSQWRATVNAPLGA